MPGSLPIRAIRGRVGEVVFKTYGRKIIVTRVPAFAGYVPSAAQRARRDRLSAATAYAKRVYSDPTAKAFYIAAAQKLGRQPFRLAVSDHLAGHPRVKAVDTLLRRGGTENAGQTALQAKRPNRFPLMRRMRLQLPNVRRGFRPHRWRPSLRPRFRDRAPMLSARNSNLKPAALGCRGMS